MELSKINLGKLLAIAGMLFLIMKKEKMILARLTNESSTSNENLDVKLILIKKIKMRPCVKTIIKSQTSVPNHFSY